jgi:nicotinamide riboside kinase
LEKIAILGAECTGKSTLLEALAQGLRAQLHRPVIALPELLREFCEREKRTPRKDEQALLIDAQIQRESAFADEPASPLSPQPVLISDCAPITIALYSQIYFDDHSLMAIATQHHKSYRLTLVTQPDIGWQADGNLRDGITIQTEFHRRLTQWLQINSIEAVHIEGTGQSREALAFAAIITTYARGPA